MVSMGPAACDSSGDSNGVNWAGGPRVDEERAVPIVFNGREQTWPLVLAGVGRDWRLTLAGPERTWDVTASDIFEALRVLRGQLDPLGIRIGVVGALPHAWASGMLRDMVGARRCYLLTIPQPPGRPPLVATLSPVPVDQVGTVAEQDEFQTRWRADRARGRPGA